MHSTSKVLTPSEIAADRSTWPCCAPSRPLSKASPPSPTSDPPENRTSISEAHTCASRAMPDPCRAISASWSATASRSPNQRARHLCSLPCCRVGADSISFVVSSVSVIQPPEVKGRGSRPPLPSGHLGGLLLCGFDRIALGFARRAALLGLQFAHLACFHERPPLIGCRLPHVGGLEDDQRAHCFLPRTRIAPSKAECTHGVGRDHQPGLLHFPLLQGVTLGR